MEGVDNSFDSKMSILANKKSSLCSNTLALVYFTEVLDMMLSVLNMY